jgi:hypothetical protein
MKTYTVRSFPIEIRDTWASESNPGICSYMKDFVDFSIAQSDQVVSEYGVIRAFENFFGTVLCGMNYGSGIGVYARLEIKDDWTLSHRIRTFITNTPDRVEITENGGRISININNKPAVYFEAVDRFVQGGAYHNVHTFNTNNLNDTSEMMPLSANMQETAPLDTDISIRENRFDVAIAKVGVKFNEPFPGNGDIWVGYFSDGRLLLEDDGNGDTNDRTSYLLTEEDDGFNKILLWDYYLPTLNL